MSSWQDLEKIKLQEAKAWVNFGGKWIQSIFGEQHGAHSRLATSVARSTHTHRGANRRIRNVLLLQRTASYVSHYFVT